jgi:hypothetical protein
MVDKLLGLLNQIKIYHWQTKSYSEHKALGKAYESLDGLVDGFIESYMGSSGSKINAGFKLSLVDYTPKSSMELMNQAETFMRGELEKAISGKSELLNIRDEMLAVIQHTKYLLSLA